MKNQSRIFVVACIVFSLCVSALLQCSSQLRIDASADSRHKNVDVGRAKTMAGAGLEQVDFVLSEIPR